jgi:hypothetical protein
MNKLAAAALAAALVAAPAAAKNKNSALSAPSGSIIFYSGVGYSGEESEVDRKRTSMDLGFAVRSIALHEGEKWRVCAKPRLKEPCVTISASAPDVAALGIDGGIASLEPVKE